jgi:uncharacterized membrane-anchored protein
MTGKARQARQDRMRLRLRLLQLLGGLAVMILAGDVVRLISTKATGWPELVKATSVLALGLVGLASVAEAVVVLFWSKEDEG